MAKTWKRPWDPANYLKTCEARAAYLDGALEDGDMSLIMVALGDIARSRRMAVVAEEAGLGRESLYKSLSANGNPEFATVLKVVKALGLRLAATTLPGDADAEVETADAEAADAVEEAWAGPEAEAGAEAEPESSDGETGGVQAAAEVEATAETEGAVETAAEVEMESSGPDAEAETESSDGEVESVPAAARVA